MPKKKRTKKSPEATHTQLCIAIDDYDVRVDASLNIDLDSRHSLLSTDESPVYTHSTHIELRGVCTYPEERAGDAYEVKLISGNHYFKDFSLTLKDVQVRDEHGIPQYRSYHGNTIPVYEKPEGIAVLEKRRGEMLWDLLAFIDPHLASNMLPLLNLPKPLYLAIHEKKFNRKRWIQNISLQTTDPAEE